MTAYVHSFIMGESYRISDLHQLYATQTAEVCTLMHPCDTVSAVDSQVGPLCV